MYFCFSLLIFAVRRELELYMQKVYSSTKERPISFVCFVQFLSCSILLNCSKDQEIQAFKNLPVVAKEDEMPESFTT